MPLPTGTGPVDPFAVSAVIGDRSAGGRAIRGGALRVSGYLVGVLSAAAASIVLLRYLGVDDFGRWVSVTALMGIVAAISDAGLTVVGQREYIALQDAGRQRELLEDVVSLRMILTAVGVALAVAFASLAGYTPAMVVGTLLVGTGLFLASIAFALTVPLTSTLRFGLVVKPSDPNVGDHCGPDRCRACGREASGRFSTSSSGVTRTLVLVLIVIGRSGWIRPRLHLRTFRPIVLTTLPIAISLVVNQVYLRVLVIEMSLLTSARETASTARRFVSLRSSSASPP